MVAGLMLTRRSSCTRSTNIVAVALCRCTLAGSYPEALVKEIPFNMMDGVRALALKVVCRVKKDR